jgi:CRP/FNR family cyclic AMP-dependent transcriptional regulator
MSLSRFTNHWSRHAELLEARPVAETSFLAGSHDEDWERIERYCVRRRFRAGEAIVRQGEIDRSLVIVLSGSLELVVSDRRGRKRAVTVIDAPSVVGEISFFDAGPRSGTLRALAPGELLQLSFFDFEALAAASPSLARVILLDAGRIVAVRLRRTTQLLLERTR